MAGLVALALPAGPDFVAALRRTWDRGDAAFPVDLRLPAAELERVMATVAPTSIVEADGEERSLAGGVGAVDGDALVVATSGTTGHPKGVILTHEAVAASARATSSALGVDPARDRWVACLPVAHIGGLSVITRALITGTPVEVHPGFQAAAVIDAADRGATLVSLVTRALADVPADRFRRILIGGAAPPPDRPSNVIATYGMTETGSGIVYERHPIAGVELDIDPEGEVLVRGDMLLRVYRSASHEWDPKSDAGWFPTGDLGRFADDGSLRVFGRKGDVITTGGEKVWPERVEPVLGRQPGVADVAVVGRPHPEWGEEVVALVVATTGDRPRLDQLRDAVKSELPVWYAPKSIVLVPSLPRTALGKIRRAELPVLLD